MPYTSSEQHLCTATYRLVDQMVALATGTDESTVDFTRLFQSLHSFLCSSHVLDTGARAIHETIWDMQYVAWACDQAMNDVIPKCYEYKPS